MNDENSNISTTAASSDSAMSTSESTCTESSSTSTAKNWKRQSSALNDDTLITPTQPPNDDPSLSVPSTPSSSTNLCSAQSQSHPKPMIPPPTDRPTLVDDFIHRFRRFPLENRTYTIPNDISSQTAFHLLKTDPCADGLFGIGTMEYHVAGSSSQDASSYIDRLAIATPSGTVCVFDVRNYGMPRDLKTLFTNRAFFVGFSYSLALSRTDSAFSTIDVDFDVAECLSTLHDHQLLRHLFAGVLPTMASATKKFFNITSPWLHESDEGCTNENRNMVAALRAIVTLDIYAALSVNSRSITAAVADCNISSSQIYGSFALDPWNDPEHISPSPSQYWSRSSLNTSYSIQSTTPHHQAQISDKYPNPPTMAQSKPTNQSTNSTPRSANPVSDGTATGNAPPFRSTQPLMPPRQATVCRPPPPSTCGHPIVDCRTTNIPERFDRLIDDLRAEFKQRFGRRIDFEWNDDYAALRQRYFDRFSQQFYVPAAKVEEFRGRIHQIIQLRLDSKRVKAQRLANDE